MTTAQTDAPSSMRPFFTIWTGQALSLIGSQAVQFALVFWLARETGSATVLAVATFLGLFPQVALGPLIGPLIDRWNRKTVMLLSDAAVALASLLLAYLFATGGVSVGAVLAILFVRAVGGAFHVPAMTASTTLMVPEKQLTRIQGLNQSMQGGLAIVTAPLGAMLLGLLSMGGILLVDVATAMVAIVPLSFTHVPRPERSEPTQSETAAGSSLWRDMVAGFCYLTARPGHMSLLGLAALVNACLVPAFALLPLLVLDQLGGNAMQLGWITSTFGVGVLAGGIALGVWGGFKQRIVTTLTGLIGLGLATLALGLSPERPILFAFGAVLAVGIAAPLTNGPILAIFQATVAPDYQGRVFAMMSTVAGATAPIGLLFAAPVAELVGVRGWYIAGGAICALAGVAGFVVPAILRIESAQPASAPLEA